MTDLTPIFNEFVKAHEAAPTRKSFNVDKVDEFLKEAYKINANIVSLHTQLRNIRQRYLSTAQPRRVLIRSAKNDSEPPPLSDRQREDIDANAKRSLRELNASIRELSDTEKTRHAIELNVIRQKFGRGLGVLGSWATGGGKSNKSMDCVSAEEKANTLNTHRESVLWMLRQRLQECLQTQQGMMEVRLNREMEKSRSVLAKARGQENMALGIPKERRGSISTKPSASQAISSDDNPWHNPADELTPEQIQMFEKENHDMLERYESTLDQVRTAEKSLIEISELQQQIADNLTVQSAHIDQLVETSYNTVEDIKGGNKELTKATQKARPAKYTFYVACGLSALFIVWDWFV